jgi:predicted GNAT family N-acyltransferase
MLCTDDLSELDLHYAPVEYLVREAAQQWERDEAMALRRAVFCIEQGIFARDDRDAVDDRAQLLVAMSCNGGMPEQVVGTVRIHRGEAKMPTGMPTGMPAIRANGGARAWPCTPRSAARATWAPR